jgi:hypothetical protein
LNRYIYTWRITTAEKSKEFWGIPALNRNNQPIGIMRVYFYLLKLRGCRGRVARPIIAVHIKYYKYICFTKVVRRCNRNLNIQWLGKGEGLAPRGSCAFPFNLIHLQAPPTHAVSDMPRTIQLLYGRPDWATSDRR